MQTRRCDKCGLENPRQYRFCGRCGERLRKRDLACRLGIHHLVWTRDQIHPCHWTGTCTRDGCHAEDHIDKHWYEFVHVRDGSCVLIQRCRYCSAPGRSIVEHTFSKWTYEREDSCVQVRVCGRCHAREWRDAEHIFGEWTYEFQGSCLRLWTCTRCGYKQRGTEEHSFGPWRRIGNIERRWCARCHAAESKPRHGAPV